MFQSNLNHNLTKIEIRYLRNIKMFTMMLSYVLFAFLSLIVKPFPVMADRFITFKFDNTVGPSKGLTCNAGDTALLAPIFNISNYKIRRQLRPIINNAIATNIDDRSLTTAATCKDRCEGYVDGFCHPMPICNKKRRTLQDEFNPLYATCPNHLAEVNARLDQLIATSTTLSSDCKILIRTDNRNATCEDGIIVGEIASFTILRKYVKMIDQCRGWPEDGCIYQPPPAPMQVTTNDISVKMTANGRIPGMLANIQVHLIPCISILEVSVVGPDMNKIGRAHV